MNKGKLFTITSLVIVYCLFLSLFAGKLLYKGNSVKEENDIGQSISIDWEELYPFDEKVELIGTKVNAKKRTLYVKVADRLVKASKIGETLSKTMFGYDEIALAGYIVNSELTDSRIGSLYLKLNNGYWARTAGSLNDLSAMQKVANQYYSLEEYVEDKDIDFLYIQTPITVSREDPQMPAGIEHYGNANIDVYLEAMANNGMSYVDLRDNFQEDAIDHYAYFYRTDHHWNLEAGPYVSGEITAELNKRFGYDLVRADEMGDYIHKTYENALFGSAGQSVTHHIESSEDFTVLYPDFDTNFHIVVKDKGIDKIGSFEELFIDYSMIEDLQKQGGGYVYESILYGNRSLITIENLDNPDGVHIVMIRDSYSIAIAPFLALSCSRLDLIDTRSDNGNFNGSIINYINETSPDIVLVLEKTPYDIKLNK